MQRTLEPLKSELSNFSTATFRSAAVSNSTKLFATSVRFFNQDGAALPFAIAVTADLGVDHIEAGAAGKIFQILWPQVSPSPVPIDHLSSAVIREEKMSITSAIQNQTDPKHTWRRRDHRKSYTKVNGRKTESRCKSKLTEAHNRKLQT